MPRSLCLAAACGWIVLVVHGAAGAAASTLDQERPDQAAVSRSIEIVTGEGPVCEAVRAQLTGNERAFAEVANADGLVWRDVWEDAAALIPDWNQSTAISEAVFDFDNDSRVDRVTVFSYFNTYMRGSVVLVSLGDSMSKRARGTAAAATEDFNDPRYWYLPCQWDERVNIATTQCPGFSQAFDEAGFSMPQSDGAQSIVFRGRYSRLIPVRIDQRSYVIVSAMDHAANGYVAVIKPLPQKKFRRTCLLKMPAEAESP